MRVSISDIETTPSMILMRASRIASKARLLVRRRSSVLATKRIIAEPENSWRQLEFSLATYYSNWVVCDRPAFDVGVQNIVRRGSGEGEARVRRQRWLDA